MKVTVKQLTDYLVSRTDNESDDQVFWNELVVRWETQKILVESEITWESHDVSLMWDVEKLGWVTSDFNWSRSVSPRIMWFIHDVIPNSDDLFNLCFDNLRKKYVSREEGVPDEIDNYSFDVNVGGLTEVTLRGIRLKPNPEEKRNKVLDRLHRQLKKRSEKKLTILDGTKIDENDHIHINDWNPYQGDSHLYEIDDKLWDLEIWVGTTDEISEVLTLDQITQKKT